MCGVKRSVVVLAAFLTLSTICSGMEAEVGRDAAGRPVLLLDGKPASMNSVQIPFEEPDATVKASAAAGVETTLLRVNLGMYHSAYGYTSQPAYMQSFWRAQDDFDDSDLERVLAMAVGDQPNRKIILLLMMGEYPEMGFRNPEEVYRDNSGIIRIREGAAGLPSEDVIVNEKGAALIRHNHFMRFDTIPPRISPGRPDRYAISFFSERWRRETCAMLEAFVRRVEASPNGKQVVGYQLSGGQDAQQYAWSPPDSALSNNPDNWSDYSPVARRAFVEWARRKYEGDIGRLNQAWKTGFTSFEQVTPPPATDLAGGKPFHDPVNERRAYDFKRFLAEGRADMLDTFAAAIKKAATRKVIVGTYGGGDGGHRRDNTTISRLLRSPNLDFFNHQVNYGVRLPPSVGGINALLESYAVNGKLFAADMDHRLWTKEGADQGQKAGSAVSVAAGAVGQAADMQMQRDMWRREMARLWISGNNGANFHNMSSGKEWDNSEIQTELRCLENFSLALIEKRCRASFMERLNVFSKDPEPTSVADVALVFDEAAVDYARSALQEYHAAGMHHQRKESLVSGVPIGYYYADDLRDGKLPPAKLVVLQNLIDLDETAARRVKALRQAGATIVVLQGTGLVQLRSGQSDFLDETLGIRLRPLNTLNRNRTATIDLNHPLLAGDSWNAPVQALDAERYKEVGDFSLTVDDSRAAVLGLYPGSGLPAAAAVEPEDGGKVIFIGAYNLSRETISRLAAYADAWRVAPPGNVIAADREILMVHPLTNGTVEVVLKEAAALNEVEPGTLTSDKALKHTLNLKAGRTYLFEQRK